MAPFTPMGHHGASSWLKIMWNLAWSWSGKQDKEKAQCSCVCQCAWGAATFIIIHKKDHFLYNKDVWRSKNTMFFIFILPALFPYPGFNFSSSTVQCIQNKQLYFADRLYDSMKVEYLKAEPGHSSLGSSPAQLPIEMMGSFPRALPYGALVHLPFSAMELRQEDPRRLCLFLGTKSSSSLPFFYSSSSWISH